MSSAEAAQPADRKQHWSDTLKQIPVGPFTLDIGGSLRVRYEFVENYNRKEYGNAKNDGFLLERFRLDIVLAYNDRFTAFLQFQDARVFSYDLEHKDFLSNPNQDVADIQQAFFQFRPFAEAPLFLTAGRQTFGYGDDRIFGPGQWGNTGRVVWDAVKLSWRTDQFFVDAFYGKTVIHDTYSFNSDHDKEAVGLYSSFFVDPDTAIDFFYALDFDRDKDTLSGNNKAGKRHIHTVGVRFDGKKKGFDWDVTYARQFGRWSSDRVQAWAMHAGIGYTFPLPVQPRLGIAYCYASGDDDPGSGKHKTFEPTFGARDRHYGTMNLFSWRNLESWQFSLELKPHAQVKLVFDYHIFRLAQAKDAWYSTGPAYRRDITGQSGKDMGKEIDITAFYSVSERFDLRVGYSRFFPGTYVKRTGPHGSAGWFHVQWMYRF